MKLPHRVCFLTSAFIWTTCAVFFLLFSLLFYQVETQKQRLGIEQAKASLTSVYLEHAARLVNHLRHEQSLDLSLPSQPNPLNPLWRIKGICVVAPEGAVLGSFGEQIPSFLNPMDRSKWEGPLFFETVYGPHTERLVLHAPLTANHDLLGYYHASLDPAEIRVAAQHHTTFAIGAVFGIVLLVGIYLQLWLSRKFRRPLDHLKAAVGMIGCGNYGKTIACTPGNELEDLVNELNEASAHLKRRHQELVNALGNQASRANQLDETNRKLARLNADLEHIVEERTRDLQGTMDACQGRTRDYERMEQEKALLMEQLAQSEKKNALGHMTASVAHELNNLLSHLVSYPELILLDLPNESPLRPKIESILSAGHNAGAMVQDLQAIARNGTIKCRPLNLNTDLISDQIAMAVEQTLGERYAGLQIETSPAQDLMKIKGNATALKKMLIHLVIQAAQLGAPNRRILIATENRYVDQPIRGCAEVAEGDYVLLRIIDEGGKIDSTDLVHFFEPFYTQKSMGHLGSGLGMTLVWRTLLDHRGYINIERNPGQGISLDLYFPVNRDDTEGGVAAITIASYMGHGETVLVIDDIKEQREVAATLLSRLNYTVYTVESGEKALDFLQHRPVDILVLDMIMDPGMDGLETYIKIIAQHPGQKAIIASGFSQTERVTKAQQLGAGPYIRKPYTLEKIALGLKNELVP